MGSQSAPIFLHGITQRSGTNFTWRLLLNHPECIPGSVGEDFLLKNAHLLHQYCEKLFESWNPRWRARFGNSSDTILSTLGNGLIELVARPYYLLSDFDENNPETPYLGNDKTTGGRFVTKTPNVDNLNLFFNIFPDAYLVVILRDGRSIVESGMKSFDWDFEEAVHRWKKSAEQVVRCIKQFESENRRFNVVRFEDLFSDTENTMVTLLSNLDLSLESYDMDSALSLPVYGSSEFKDDEDSVNWKPIAKGEKFDPSARWSSWDEKMHSRFNWIAGKTMVELNYSLAQQKDNLSMTARNIFLDTKYLIVKVSRKLRGILGK